MNYYEVAVGTNKYHGNDYLIYHCADLLKKGTVVSVPLRKQQVFGLVIRNVAKPQTHPTKAVTKVVIGQPLPNSSLELMDRSAAAEF
jgi:primosomal protein N'